MRARIWGVVALAAILCLTGIVPSASGSPDSRTGTRGPDPLEAQWVPLPPGSDATPIPSETPVPIVLTLQPSTGSALAAFDQAVADPSSPMYRHYLTESQFETRFSPSPSNVSDLVGYFSGAGARDVSISPDRLAVSFVLPAGDAGRAFGTQLVEVAGPSGETLRTSRAVPTLPDGLARQLLGVSGLSGVAGPGAAPPMVSLPSGRSISSGSPDAFLNGTGRLAGTQWFVGSDFVRAYDESPLLPGSATPYPNATYPSDEAVATLLMSSYNSSLGENLPPWDPAQVDDYFNQTFPPSWPHPDLEGVPVEIDNVTPPAPGSLGGLNDTSLDEEENSLDLEMAGSMAPGAQIVNFYFAASLYLNASVPPPVQTVAGDFGLALGSALSHNYSPRRLASVSASFGLPDLNNSAWDVELEHAAATGVTVVASSGDQGNAPNSLTGRGDGAWPTWPASAAFNNSGTMAIGGVTLGVSGTPTGTFNGTGAPTASYDGSIHGIASQQTWYDTLGGPGNYSGSEGGISLEFAEPYWQFHSAAQPPVSASAGSEAVIALGRAEPDVSFAANDTIAFVSTNPDGSVNTDLLEGTSIAAPLFAGLLAEWAAVDGHPFGYLDPELYRMASYFAAEPGPADPFLDVTQGQNDFFSAAPGWDATTGWGGIDAEKFLAADANGSIRGYVYTGPTPGLPIPSNTAEQTDLLFAIPLGIVIAGVIVVWIGLERRRPTVPSGPPPALRTPPPGTPEGTWFACPYCGAARPSDPVRCPGCGRF